ncbi:MAG: InlB B-repeat-containing protein [Clostridia bacterium]|nr:InlB B-repeat-containing protein [Clostridia bacterium]
MKRNINAIIKRATALLLIAVLLVGFAPETLLDNLLSAGAETGYHELSDGYLSVKVSKSNGGFLVDTVEGDKLNKSDNNKYLLYPDENYDTSFTSFRVKRGATTAEYVFGRDYSHMGIETSAVTVTKVDDTTISAVWTVDGIKFTQQVALLAVDNYQHGMVYVTVSAENVSGEAIDELKARVLMDTALGHQDYAVYMAGQADGSYTTIKTEQTLTGSEYSNYFFAYDDEMAPSVTAYTVNASIGGVTVVPEKVTFAHWNSLASTVYDYNVGADVKNNLNFTNPYNKEYLTADSAFAMYYDMGSAPANAQSTKSVAFYYGVYSNVSAELGSVAVNFIGPAAMELAGDIGYVDTNGDSNGNMSLTVKIQNTSDEVLDTLAIAFYPESGMTSYDTQGNLNLDATIADPYYEFLIDLRPGEARDVTIDLAVAPSDVTEYRKIGVKIFDVSEKMGGLGKLHLMDEDLVFAKETYVLCPSVDGGVLSFVSTTPEVVYRSGTRSLFIAGKNFGLLRDSSQYRVILRPLDGGKDIVVPSENFILNNEDNTASIIIEDTLPVGTWQIIFDWVDAALSDSTSDALRFVVTNNPSYISGNYGVIGMRRTGDGSEALPWSYKLILARDEDEYRSKIAGISMKDIIYELRGDFSVKGENGKIEKLEAIARKDGDAIEISGAIQVTEGRVTVSIEYDDEGNQTAINTDIDGKVYTVGANTKVWEGVCAITSLEEGDLVKLPIYKYDGTESNRVEDAVANTNFVSLMWPGGASDLQTLAGMLLELRYCHFALMATKPGSYDPDLRVVTFGAQLDPSFLVPSTYDWGIISPSPTEEAEVNLANTDYTSGQLRELEDECGDDRMKWYEAQGGTLALYIHNIFFGGKFIGINTSVEVGLPSYTDGMPEIGGTLDLMIMNGEWGIGIEGEADIEVLTMEAEFRLRSYNGIPVPDKIRFHVGGNLPGIPIDPFGVFWIRGMGAGIDKIYETYFVSSTIPPLTLILSGEFALFDLLTARGDISMSGRGIEAYLSNIGIGGITLIDRLGGFVYWYPRLNMKFGIDIDILDIIYGSGAIALQEMPTGFEDDTEFFWEGFVTAGIKLPALLGGFEIGSAELGVNNDMIWGAIHILKLDAGVTYHWGGDVEFAFGKYDAPEATLVPMALKSAPVYTDPATGRTLYAKALTNARLLGTTLSTPIDETVISSGADKRTHRFVIDANDDENAILVLNIPAENEAEAEAIKSEFTVTCGGKAYEIVWLDNGKAADSPENAGANAMINYDGETGYATITLSFTEADSFGNEIVVTTANASELALYGVEKMASIDSVSLSADGTTAAVSGTRLEKLDNVSIYAIDNDGNAFLLGKAGEGYDSIAISYPSELQSGTYTLKAVGTQLDGNGDGVASPSAEDSFSYVNPNQPDATASVSIALGGDYTIDAEVEAVEGAEGYYVSIYEQATDGSLSSTLFSGMKVEGESFTVGGRYDSVSDDGETVTSVGLTAGCSYVVAVSAFRTAEDGGIILSEETLSDAIVMAEPVKSEAILSLKDGVSLSAGYGGVDIDATGSDSPVINVSGVDGGKGSYSINGGEAAEWNGGDISLRGLEDGIYTVSLKGENATKDSFGTVYQFIVDTKAPTLRISSPINGGFFDSELVEVKGTSEAGATVSVTVGDVETTAVAGEDGSFSVAVELDTATAYQKLTVKATDALGNESDEYALTLTNKLIGSEDAKAVIVSDGAVITKLGAAQNKKLSLALKVGDKLVKLHGGAMGSMVEYRVDVKKGSASVDENGVINVAEGTVGIVVASLDTYQAAAVFVSNDLADAAVTLDIPEEGFVYDETKKTPAVLSVVLGNDQVPATAYDVSYSANIAAGMAIATVTAKDGSGYSGKIEIPFYIAPVAVGTLDIDVATPVRGETAQTSVTAPAGCAEAEISWTVNGEPFEGEFTADTTYVATVTLAPLANHTFDADTGSEGWTATLNDDGTLTLTREFYIPLITYTVTFMAYGEVVAERTVNEGDALTDIPAIPEKEGYTQTAPVWDVSDFSNIMSDMTVNAVYTRNTYTVTFMADGAVVAEKTVTHGDTLSDIPSIPEKIGYTQTAPVWDVTNFNNVTGDMTVNAVYTVNTYTVTFMADGAVVATRTVTHGASIDSLPAIPDKTGHDQTAPVWDNTDLDDIVSDLTVNAVYTRNVYTVRFVVDGVEISTIRMEYGQSLAGTAFPAIPERENYDASWDRTGIDSIATDMTVTATYKQNYIIGDVNGDGDVDSRDAHYILRYDADLIDADELRMIAADVNCDGKVNSLDAALVLRFEADLIESFDEVRVK